MAEKSGARQSASDLNHVLDFGSGIYEDIFGGFLDGAFSWFDDPTGAKASQEALNKQLALGEKAIDFQGQMYDQTRKDLAPWMAVGKDSLNQLNSEMDQLTDTFTMNDFVTDPGYQFRLQEGEKAINRAMSSKGLRNSTAAVKSLNDYNQGMASSEINNAFNRYNQNRDQRYNKLAGLAGMGQTQSQTMAGAATGFGQSVGDVYTGMGNAIAAEGMNRANFNQGTTGQFLDIGGMLGGMAMSDEREKTNIEDVSDEDLQELKDSIKAYKFNYKDKKNGKGDWVGVMAQDLEKSKLGRELVETGEDGKKRINMKKVGSLFLATMAEGA